MVVVVALAAGTALIIVTLHVPRGSAAFVVTGYLLAFVWVCAAMLARPIPWIGLGSARNDLALGVATGVATFGVFVLAAWIGKRISVLSAPIDSVLARADAASVAVVLTLALVNGVGEELFFRGALPRAIGSRSPLVLSTVLYVGVIAVAGNTALTLAAIVMGTVFAVERRRTGGLIAPVATHLVWTTLILVALPR